MWYIKDMDIDVLKKQALSGIALDEVGKEFFADKTLTKEQIHTFLTALLKEKAYENLATVMSYGYIDNVESGRLPNQKKCNRLSNRYFNNFMELAEYAEVDKQLVYPMLFAAFDAPKSSYLYSFVGGIDAYFTKFTSADYDAALEIIRRYDKKYKCLSTLMEADKTRTVSEILNQLIYGKSANKTLLRKYILEKRVDIVPSLCREYLKSHVREKEGIIRILLLYKSDPRAARFLEEVEKSEKSVTIKRLIEKDRNCSKKTKPSAEEETVGKIEKDGKTYTLTPNIDLTVTITPQPYPKEAKAAAEKIEKRLRAVCEEMESDMVNNVRVPCKEFTKRIETDPIYACLASSLLFSVYKNGTMSDVIVVENGKINDLDNKRRDLHDEEVAVSHPTEWEKYSFLKTLTVEQPFSQIRREIYYPSDSEKTYNYCGRLRGVVITAGELKAALNKYGFKLLNKNRYAESCGAAKTRGDVTCVLEFSATNFADPRRLISMNDVRFYKYGDLIKLGGQTYLDGVQPYSIAQLPAVTFSEFLHDVFELLGLRGER